MENVGHINRSEGLTSSYKYDEWVGGEFKDITHTNTHTHCLPNLHLSCVVAPLKRTVLDLVVTIRVWFFSSSCFDRVFPFFLFTLSGAQREVGEKAKDLKGPLKKRNA